MTDDEAKGNALLLAIVMASFLLPAYGAGAYASMTPATDYDVLTVSSVVTTDVPEEAEGKPGVVQYESLSESDQKLVREALNSKGVTDASEKASDKLLSASYVVMPSKTYSVQYHETVHTLPGVGAYVTPSVIPVVWNALIAIALLTVLGIGTHRFGIGEEVASLPIFIVGVVLMFPLTSFAPIRSTLATAVTISGVGVVVVLVLAALIVQRVAEPA